MDFERTTFPTLPVLSTSEVKEYLRVDLSNEDDLIDALIATATREVEDFAQIALIEQTIRARYRGPIKSGSYQLPVSPVLEGASPVFTIIEPDGTTTALGSEYATLTPGKVPRFWIQDVPALPALLGEVDTVLGVDYPAGFGADASDVPSDLKHAIRDQVAWLFDMRGGHGLARHAKMMSASAIRIAQRYRRSNV